MLRSPGWHATVVLMLTLLNIEEAVLIATALPYSSTNVEVLKSQEVYLNQFGQQIPPTQTPQRNYQNQQKTVPQVQYNRQPALGQRVQQFQSNRQQPAAANSHVQYKRQPAATTPSAVQQSNYRPVAAAAVAASPQPNALSKRTQPPAAAATTPRIPTVEEIKAAEKAVVKASNDFARDLYEQVRWQPGNFVISPLSISGVLALTWLGAAGRTAQQISTALHLPPSTDQVIDGYRHLYQSLQADSSPDMQLATGSKVFVRRGLALKEDFRRLAKDAFAAEADEIDFSRPNDAAAVINNWVKQRTYNKISPFIEPEALSPETSLLLANAVYFKAKWETPFDPQETSVRAFRDGRSDAAARNVTLMYTHGDFPFANIEELQAKAVRLPYVKQRASMVVVLPDAVDGLAKLEAALSSAKWPLERVLSAMKAEEVHVWLPRFTASASLTLNGPLTKLGLGELFGGSADFSGLASAAGSFLSQVMQKAFIEVNEEGTESAAASGGIFFLSAGLYNFFRADHPFLFYIIDDRTGTILFQGHFTSPED